MRHRLVVALSLLAALGWVGIRTSQTTSAQAPAPPAGQGPALDGAPAISGRVVDGVSGTPLAGAMVSLAAMEGPTEQTPRLIETQVTDAGGRFNFTHLSATRTYQIAASKPGYFAGAYGVDTSRSAPRRIMLTENQSLRDATIALWRPASITGTILDEAGDPVVGIPVAAVAQVLVAGVPQWASGPLVRTDDRGVYRIAPLSPGVYAVMVPTLRFSVPAAGLPPSPTPNASAMLSNLRELVGYTADGKLVESISVPPMQLTPDQHALPVDDGGYLIVQSGALQPPPTPDGQRRAYPLTFYPAARSISGALPIELGAAEERVGVDRQLQPVPVRRVGGVVEGPANAIANRRLRLVTPDSQSMGVGHEVATTFTGPTGQFSFLDVPDGPYTILAATVVDGYTYSPPSSLLSPSLLGLFVAGNRAGASAPTGGTTAVGQSMGTPTWVRTTIGNLGGRSDLLTGWTPVEVAGTDRRDVVVRLRGTGSISGRIVIDTPEDRRAIEVRATRLEVAAEPASAQSGVPAVRTETMLTGQALNFALTNLRPGDYILRMYADSGMAKSIVLGGKDYAGLPLTLSDHDISGVVITVTSQTARAEGRVRDGRGDAAGYAAVICFPADPARWRRYGPRPDRIRSAPVRQGSYEIRVPAGDYYLVAVDEALADRWRDPAFLEAASRVATRVSLGWGEISRQDLAVVDVR